MTPSHVHTGRTIPVLMLMSMGLAAGCREVPGGVDRPVARAYGNVLPWQDLRKAVPVDASAADSAAMADRYIRNWLEQQVLLHKADENMATNPIDMEAQLRDYRNSLLIFAYERALVEQKLDTLVRAVEIEGYYEANRSSFELKQSLVRARWTRVQDDDRRTMEKLKAHFLSGDPQRLSELEMWQAQHGYTATDRSQVWITMPELIASVPMDEPNSPGRQVVKRDGSTWFVDLLELRTKGTVSPLELVQPDIRAIIINQRKLLLIERMRQDLFREAIENKEIEVL